MIFIDTNAWLGRLHPRDQYHRLASDTWREIALHEEPCSTSSLVLSELLTLLGRRVGHRSAAQRAREIYRSDAMAILRPTEDDEMKALAYFEKFADQGVSFADCVSFALMRRHRIKRVFTFDRHFALAGFEAVPGAVSAAGWISEGPPEESAEEVPEEPTPAAR
jgi:predicted nucleic acid-binding protein